MAPKVLICQFMCMSIYELIMYDDNDDEIISYKALMVCNHGNRTTPNLALSFTYFLVFIFGCIYFLRFILICAAFIAYEQVQTTVVRSKNSQILTPISLVWFEYLLWFFPKMS